MRDELLVDVQRPNPPKQPDSQVPVLPHDGDELLLQPLVVVPVQPHVFAVQLYEAVYRFVSLPSQL